jgi:hypothetical protein
MKKLTITLFMTLMIGVSFYIGRTTAEPKEIIKEVVVKDLEITTEPVKEEVKEEEKFAEDDEYLIDPADIIDWNTNGEEISLDVPARIISSRTMVPVRAVSECLDAKVGWNDFTRTVIISSDESLNKALLMFENCDDVCFTADTEAEENGSKVLMNIKVGLDLKN